MNQKEQTRLQVLNGLLAEQITLDQAAELMAVSSRHARRMLAAYQDRGQLPSPMATVATDRSTPHPRR